MAQDHGATSPGTMGALRSQPMDTEPDRTRLDIPKSGLTRILRSRQFEHPLEGLPQ